MNYTLLIIYITLYILFSYLYILLPFNIKIKSQFNSLLLYLNNTEGLCPPPVFTLSVLITLSAIIKDPTPALTNLFDEIKQKFGDERRTKITQVSESKEEKEIEFIEPEKCVVVMSEDGLIKSGVRSDHFMNGKVSHTE